MYVCVNGVSYLVVGLELWLSGVEGSSEVGCVCEMFGFKNVLAKELKKYTSKVHNHIPSCISRNALFMTKKVHK